MHTYQVVWSVGIKPYSLTDIEAKNKDEALTIFLDDHAFMPIEIIDIRFIR